MYDDAAFGKLNGVPHPCPYDIRCLIGLCDEISRTQVKAFDLSLLLRCEDYDGYAPQLAVGADDFKQAVAVKLGHMQIEYHKGKLQLVPPDDIKGCDTVLCVLHLVQVAEHGTKHLPLHKFIVNYEYAPAQAFFSFK